MLTAQLGDLVQRARRAMKLTGRIPFALDEALIPTVQLLDLQGDPFAQYPRRWSWAFTATGNGTLGGLITLRNPPASGALVVIDGIEAANNVGGYRLLQVYLSRQSGITAGISQPQITNIPSLTTASAARTITLFANGTGSPTGSILAQAYTANWSNPIWPPDSRIQVTLYPGDDLYITSPVAAVDFQQGFVYGREYPDTAI